MLSFALRRALWAIPTLFGVSLVVFLLTTLLPDTTAEALGRLGRHDVGQRLALEDQRRARFLDLPSLVNDAPVDVRERATQCVAHIVAGDELSESSTATLARLGGAAFPHVLPDFARLPPTERRTIARALSPVAVRMHLADERILHDDALSERFFTTFWDDRAIDFTRPATQRAVARLVNHWSPTREHEVEEVDTFALGDVFEALQRTTDRRTIASLTRVASHVTGRDGVVAESASEERARSQLAEWRSWWFVHRLDYVTLSGSDKFAVALTETRYAKWVLGAVTGQLGLSTRDSVPLGWKLRQRAGVTLILATLSMLVSLAVSIPLGVWMALRRGGLVDRVGALVLFALYAVPTFVVAEALAHLVKGTAAMTLAILTLSLATLSTTTQQQRASLLEALGQDYVRAARARGVGPVRVALVHALRNALLPVVSLAGLKLPVMVGSAFVVEEVFQVPGVGWETLRAIESQDTPWVVVVVLFVAALTTLSLVASDIAMALLDPRAREWQSRAGRASG